MGEEVKLSRETMRELINGIGEVVGGKSRSSFGSGGSGSSMNRENNSALSGFTSGTKGMFNDVTEVMGNWQSSVDSFGVSMNNDALGLTTSVKGTRMSLVEWGNIIADNVVGLSAFGGTMTEGARLFNSLSKEFTENPMSASLREMGMSLTDYNKLLMVTMKSNKSLNLQDKEGRRVLFESTASLGREMDKVSKLTGISKQELMSKMQQDALDPRFSARKRLQQKRGFGAGVAAMDKIQNLARIAGIEDLTKNVYEGGAITEKSAYQMTAMGGQLSNELQSLVTQIRNTSDPAKSEALVKRFESLSLRASAELNSEKNLTIASVGSGPYQEALAETSLKASGTAESMAKLQENAGKSLNDAAAALLKIAENEQKGLDAKGMEVIGSELVKSQVQISRLADTLEAIQAPVYQALGAKAGEKLANANAPGQIGDLERKAQLKLGESATRVSDDIRQGNVKDIFGVGAKTLKDGADMFKDSVKIFKDVMVEAFAPDKTEIKPAETKPEIPKYSEGTKEVHGDWFGGQFGKGMDAILHGNEAVIPRAKLSEFLADMKIPQQISMPVPEQKPNTQTPPVDNTDTVILKDINNQLTTLNAVMITLVKNTADLVYTGHKEYNAIKKLSPNLNTR